MQICLVCDLFTLTHQASVVKFVYQEPQWRKRARDCAVEFAFMLHCVEACAGLRCAPFPGRQGDRLTRVSVLGGGIVTRIRVTIL